MEPHSHHLVSQICQFFFEIFSGLLKFHVIFQHLTIVLDYLNIPGLVMTTFFTTTLASSGLLGKGRSVPGVSVIFDSFTSHDFSASVIIPILVLWTLSSNSQHCLIIVFRCFTLIPTPLLFLICSSTHSAAIPHPL